MNRQPNSTPDQGDLERQIADMERRIACWDPPFLDTTPAHQNGGNTMKAKDLIERLQALPEAEVYVHDESTDDDLPIGKVDIPYGGPITLHAKGGGGE